MIQSRHSGWTKDRQDLVRTYLHGDSNRLTKLLRLEMRFIRYRQLTKDRFECRHSRTCSKFWPKRVEQHGFTQDPDVLDTWFSSWLWPFATMGWPEQTRHVEEILSDHRPRHRAGHHFLLGRAHDHGRLRVHGRICRSENVYFTGIIRDKQGRKMSKSLGNSPDPLDLIAKYGADALRFGTMRSAPLGQDILFDEQNVELGRNFCNKLWNACRFRQMVGSGAATPSKFKAKLIPSFSRPMTNGFCSSSTGHPRNHRAFAEYKFSDATATLYRFFWSEYCDWYVEASKAVVSAVAANGSRRRLPTPTSAARANTLAVIDFVLSHTLRLFHPFLPFITEELWHGMGYAEDMPENQGGKTIMFAPWPKPLDDDFKSHYGLTGRR